MLRKDLFLKTYGVNIQTLWQELGLNLLQVVLDQVSAYKSESDIIAKNIEQKCSLEAHTKYSASKLYEAYRQFCQTLGSYP